MTADNARSVVVVGMHRSGTSAVAHAVHLLGLRAPARDDLLAAHDNPEGHWESIRLVAVNDELLEAFGGGWDVPPPLRPGWERTTPARQRVSLARAGLGGAFPRAPWVWKDPRLCLTLRFWLAIVKPEPVVVLVWRAPGAVCASLAARNGFDVTYSLALWERYLRSALLDAGGRPVVTVDYDALLADPAGELDALAHALDTCGVRVGDGSDAVAAIDARLRHHRSSVPAEASPQQRALFERLRELPHVGPAPAPDELGPETPGNRRAFATAWQEKLRERSFTSRWRARGSRWRRELSGVLTGR
jgi:hypothetical protein